MSVGQPLQDIALVELATGALGTPEHRATVTGKAKSQKHCVLLRAGGLLSLLNMEEGAPHVLCSAISETSWVPYEAFKAAKFGNFWERA